MGSMFKRDKVFKQFALMIYGLTELKKPKELKCSGLLKFYQTDWDETEVLRQANALGLILAKDNDKATSFTKRDRGFNVTLIYNKNDKSILIAISRIR